MNPYQQNWTWQDIATCTAQSDPVSKDFYNTWMSKLILALDLVATPSPFKKIDPSLMDTKGKRFRVYFLGFSASQENTFAFVRNENRDGVKNWWICFREPKKIKFGDFVDFPALDYQEDYGGFLADVFVMTQQGLVGSSLGTNAFSYYTSTESHIYEVSQSSLYLIDMKLGSVARLCFALQILQENGFT
jgi:hypothetical protein